MPSSFALDLVIDACILRGLAQCCCRRGLTCASAAAESSLRPAAAFPDLLLGGSLKAQGRGQQRGEGVGRDFFQQQGWPALLVGCGPGFSRGGGSAVECLVLPGNVFVFVVV